MFSLSKRKGNDDLKPVIEKQRYQCPFYGFHMAMGMLMDQSGNQCALITDSYSPCQMEIRSQTPNWNECPLNNEENSRALEKIADQLTIFPEEFHPKEAKSWRGMPFKNWQKYIMERGVCFK